MKGWRYEAQSLESGHEEILRGSRQFLQNFGLDNFADTGRTMLTDAYLAGRPFLIQVPLMYGAEPNLPDANGDLPWSPVFSAYTKYQHLVQNLLAIFNTGGDPNPTVSEGVL
jgi:hypothetical protein